MGSGTEKKKAKKYAKEAHKDQKKAEKARKEAKKGEKKELFFPLLFCFQGLVLRFEKSGKAAEEDEEARGQTCRAIEGEAYPDKAGPT